MIFISPPFGSHLQIEGCVSVKGSFTWERRGGRAWRVLKTLRRVPGGWRNSVGLRNPGVKSLAYFDPDSFYSLAAIQPDDWTCFLGWLPPEASVELNLGCPNSHSVPIHHTTLECFCKRFRRVSVKLPPTPEVDELAEMAVSAGALFLHCSNTLPTPRGGVSGEPLFRVNRPIVARLAIRFPGQVIAGGGIYSVEQVKEYISAGALHFSLSTVFFNPLRARALLRAISPLCDRAPLRLRV